MVELTTGEGIGGSVRRARRSANLTLRQLATAIHVSAGTMSAIENDRVSLTVSRLAQIAEELGVPEDQLLHPPNPTSARQVPAASEWRTFHDLELGPVLTSAVEVFRETGYHGATMRMIAAGADISVAGIYHHYPSKQHLLQEILLLTHQDLNWRLEAAAHDAENPTDAVANIVEALVLFREQRAALAFVTVTEASRAETSGQNSPEHVHAGIRDRLARTAYQARSEQISPPVETSLTVQTIMDMCLTPAAWAYRAQPADPGHIARQYALLACTMLGLEVQNF